MKLKFIFNIQRSLQSSALRVAHALCPIVALAILLTVALFAPTAFAQQPAAPVPANPAPQSNTAAPNDPSSDDSPED